MVGCASLARKSGVVTIGHRPLATVAGGVHFGRREEVHNGQ